MRLPAAASIVTAGALALSGVAAVTVLGHRGTAGGRSSPGDGRHVDSYGFGLDGLTVPRTALAASGLSRDGVPVLDRPVFLAASEINRRHRQRHGRLLVPSDRVVGLSAGGAALAFPLRILQWHEIANTTLAGEPAAVTYSPLCDSVAVYSRRVGGRTVRFGHSGLLWQSNLLLYDRDTPSPSLWCQLSGRAVAGPAAGTSLHRLPFVLTTWRWWRAEHPATRVLAPDPRLAREYRRSPYSSYFGSDILRFPVSPLPPPSRLRLKDRVVAVTAGGSTRAFALPELARAAGAPAAAVRRTVGRVPVAIAFDAVRGTAEVRSLDPRRPVDAVTTSFWFAWWAAGRQDPGREAKQGGAG